MNKIKLMVIDKDMCSTVIEINSLYYKSLGINKENVKKHESKRDLNVEITKFLQSFEGNNE